MYITLYVYVPSFTRSTIYVCWQFIIQLSENIFTQTHRKKTDENRYVYVEMEERGRGGCGGEGKGKKRGKGVKMYKMMEENSYNI